MHQYMPSHALTHTHTHTHPFPVLDPPDGTHMSLSPTTFSFPVVLAAYEWVLREAGPFNALFSALRNASLRYAMDYMHAEDAQTHYIDIGPVNKVRPPSI